MSKPANWPEDVPFPSEAEIQKAVDKMKEAAGPTTMKFDPWTGEPLSGVKECSHEYRIIERSFWIRANKEAGGLFYCTRCLSMRYTESERTE